MGGNAQKRPSWTRKRRRRARVAGRHRQTRHGNSRSSLKCLSNGWFDYEGDCGVIRVASIAVVDLSWHLGVVLGWSEPMFLLDGIGLNMHRRDYNPVRKEMIETLRQFQVDRFRHRSGNCARYSEVEAAVRLHSQRTGSVDGFADGKPNLDLAQTQPTPGWRNNQ
jgi:hypothetical protein